MRNRVLLVLTALTLLLGGAACSSGGSASSGSTSSSAVLGAVDTMFGRVEVPAPKDGDLTVVALGWSDAEMALALGIKPVAVYDWQGFGQASKGVGPWATSRFGDVTPTVIPNSTQNLNYEQLQGLQPDVILNVRSDNDQAVAKRLSTIAPTIYAPSGTGAFATAWDVQMQQIADATGHGADGKRIVADVQGQIDSVASKNPAFKGHTVASSTKFGDAYGAYLAGDNRFDILADLGFVQNPPILKLPASGFFANVSAENISALDADVTVMLPIGFTLAQTQSDPLVASLASVRQGRAVFIDPASQLSGAWSAGSVLSIPVVLTDLVPQLATAVGKTGG